RSLVLGDCTCTTRPHSINRMSVANVRLIMVLPFTTACNPLALLLRRVVLENLVHRVGDVLVPLLRLRIHVDPFLGGHPAPHQLSPRGISHVDHERPDQDVPHLCRRRAAAPASAIAPPVWPVAAAIA